MPPTPLHAIVVEPTTLTDHVTTELLRSAAVSHDAALMAAHRAITAPLVAGKLPEAVPLADAYTRAAHSALARHVAENIRAWSVGHMGDDVAISVGHAAVDAWIVTTPGAGQGHAFGASLRNAAARVRALLDRMDREWSDGDLPGSPGYTDCPRCGATAPERHPGPTADPALCPHPFHATTAAGVSVLRAAAR